MITTLIHSLDKDFREVIGDASTALVLKIAAAIVSFALYVVIARILGPADSGVFFLAMAIVTIVSMAGRIGLDNTILRFAAISANHEDWQQVSSLYLRSISLAVIVSSGLAISLAISADVIAEKIFSAPHLGQYLKLIALATVPMALANIHAQLLKGLKRIAGAIVTESMVIPGITICILPVLGKFLGINGAVIAHITASSIALIIGYYLCRRAIPVTAGPKIAFPFSMLIKTSWPLFLASILQLISDRSSTLILGVFRDSSEIGIFEVANRTSFLISFVLIAINSTTAAKFAALHRAGDIDALERIAKRCATITAIAAAPLYCLFIFAPDSVLLLFGSEFKNGAIALMILATGQYFNVVTGSVGALLIMTGNERPMLLLTLASAILIVTINFLLIPYFGIMGAAVSVAITLVLKNLAAVALVHRYINISVLPWSRSKIIRTRAE